MAYNEKKLERLATDLQRRATAVIIWSVVFVAGLGAGVTAAIMHWRPSETGDSGGGMIWIAAAAGAVVGYLVGTERAFGLRYQSQSAFCLIQIERNTRRGPRAESRADTTHAAPPTAPAMDDGAATPV